MGQYFGSGKGKRSTKSPVGLFTFGIFMHRRTVESERKKMSNQSKSSKGLNEKGWMEVVLLREKIPRRQPKPWFR